MVFGAAGEDIGEELGGEGREQDAIAVVPGGPEEPVHRSAPDRGEVVGRRRTEPDGELLDVVFEEPRQQLTGVAQELVDARCGWLGVKAALLHRGPEHVATVATRNDIAAGEAQDVLQEPRAFGIAQTHDLSLEWPHRHTRVGEQALDI